MGVLSKPRTVAEAAPWVGETPLWYRYTFGVAGERFFREIKENRKLFGSKCPTCDNVYVPAKMYCAECYEYTQDWVEVPFLGTVTTYTVLHKDLDDKDLPEPVIVAFISFPGTKGGLIHRIEGLTPAEVELGLQVEPVFDPQPKGGPTDILHFRPVEKTSG